ncbi:hypothetical protein B0T10DRAFT_448125 [Thelonectria olida]|uniref:Uncharacterized protein n=1 Tax=Thelonectria olida TaxID=1576542 RepID=A0A9P9AKB5_9HYPO|nr:hypothetical protein B0T10DRAFT_448125 [Thelonectria olida]
MRSATRRHKESRDAINAEISDACCRALRQNTQMEIKNIQVYLCKLVRLEAHYRLQMAAYERRKLNESVMRRDSRTSGMLQGVVLGGLLPAGPNESQSERAAGNAKALPLSTSINDDTCGRKTELNDLNQQERRRLGRNRRKSTFPGQILPCGRPSEHVKRRRGRSAGPQESLNPAPGEVCCVYWKKSKQFFAVLCLPMQNMDYVGICGSIESMGLLEHLPECYAYDPQTKTFSWKQGYEDGEPRVSRREFPVMYFDGSPFPSKSAVGWVAGGDLQVYDESTQPLVAYNEQVQQFLDRMNSITESSVPKKA